MNSVTVDGVIYTKANILAKKFGYTTDYIGQLCRAEKVDAQVIGRTWYVREDTLLVHKDSRYKSLRENEIISKSNTHYEEIKQNERVMVLPVLSKNTKRSVIARQSEPNFFSHLNHISPLRYESDEAELLPRPTLAEAKKVPVLLADSEKVSVRLVDKTAPILEFTELPSISLKGILPVMPYEIVGEELLTPITLPPAVSTKSTLRTTPVTVKLPNPFVPATLPAKSVTSTSGLKVVFSSLLLACVVSFILVFFDSYISFEGSVNSEKLIFNVAALGALFGI